MASRPRRFLKRGLAVVALAAAAGVVGAVPPLASADRVYHSQHLALAPLGNAPLRSGFVENIKANGPTVYAHEIYVLNGALPGSTYTVTRNFYFQDSDCGGDLVFHSDVAVLATNAAGNARRDVLVRPSEVAGLQGVHGVIWTVTNSTGEVVYQTDCTAVTLD